MPAALSALLESEYIHLIFVSVIVVEGNPLIRG